VDALISSTFYFPWYSFILFYLNLLYFPTQFNTYFMYIQFPIVFILFFNLDSLELPKKLNTYFLFNLFPMVFFRFCLFRFRTVAQKVENTYFIYILLPTVFCHSFFFGLLQLPTNLSTYSIYIIFVRVFPSFFFFWSFAFAKLVEFFFHSFLSTVYFQCCYSLFSLDFSILLQKKE
jgi:hypothetical protein